VIGLVLAVYLNPLHGVERTSPELASELIEPLPNPLHGVESQIFPVRARNITFRVESITWS
jgi:hypothetical protein